MAWVWGLLAAAIGLLGIWPSVAAPERRRLAWSQLVATENPGLGLVSGLLALRAGLRQRKWGVMLLGGLGVSLGLRPLVRRQHVNRAMADAMREGLGIGWQRRIPAAMYRTFGQTHRTDTWGPWLYMVRARVRVTHDVLFATPDGHPLRLDIYEPRRAATAPRPAILLVHGGAWFQREASVLDFGLHQRWLAGQGYVVFDAHYRFGAGWPAPLADVKSAQCWVKANAARFGADPTRIALMGHAAGGHLALLAAYTAGDDEHVCAVIASDAPTDLRLWPAQPDSAISALLGGLPAEQPAAYAEASPVTHVRAGLPPTLLIHGQRNRLVSPSHAELLTNHLRAEGVTAVNLRIPWGRHGVHSLLLGLTGPMIQYDVDRFLAWAFSGEHA